MLGVPPVADTSRNIRGGGRNFQHVCLRCPLKICEFSNIMLGISNSLFNNYCNVTITLYAYILVCFFF